MLISHEKKFVFIHVPKTGGKSIVHDLGQYCPISSKSNPQNKCHSSAVHIKKRLSEFDSFFSFAFVRNPWDRAVSHYCFSKGEFNWSFSFPEYVQKKVDGTLPTPYPTQSSLVFDSSGNLIVDFIGRFENFQHDYNHIRKEIGLISKVAIHKNATSHKPYKEFYNKELRDLIGTLYREDIKNFDYMF